MHQILVLEPHSFKMTRQWHTSDSLDTKCNYALIKKELLAIKFGADGEIESVNLPLKSVKPQTTGGYLQKASYHSS